MQYCQSCIILIAYLLDLYIILNSDEKQLENVIDTLGTVANTRYCFFYSTVGCFVLRSLLARCCNSGNGMPKMIATTIEHPIMGHLKS